MKKWHLISTVLILIFIASSFYLYSLLSSPSLSPSELEECKTIKDGGDIDIVFFSTKKEAQEYSNYFLKKEPFKKHKEKFSFHYIDTYDPKCELYEDKALLCYNKELAKKSSSCPNDHIVVIEERPSRIRSSSYMEVMSINKEHPKSVFLHEFGHNFITLADEYVPAILPWASDNCVDSCHKFKNKGGCYKGCSEENRYRSIEKGVMRSLDSEKYGAYNTHLIEKELKSQGWNPITGLVAKNKDCSEKEYFLIEAFYGEEEIQIIDKTKKVGCPGKGGSGAFSYQTNLERKNIGQKFKPVVVLSDSREGGEVFSREEKFDLKVPAANDRRDIKKKGERLESVELKINNQPCKT